MNTSRIEVHVDIETDMLTRFATHLSESETRKATARAINYALRRTRVQMKRDITAVFKIKSSLVANEVFKISNANRGKLWGTISADVKPIPLDKFEPTVKKDGVVTKITAKGSKSRSVKRGGSGGVFVEVIRGRKMQLPGAFLIRVGGGVKVKMRGHYEKPGFVHGTSRLPISTIFSKSVFYATQDKAVVSRYAPFTENQYLKELMRQLNGAVHF